MATLVTDSFDRADSTGLGSNWSGAAGGYSAADIVSNRAQASSSGSVRVSAYTGYGTFPNDQWAQFTVGNFDTSNAVWINVRQAVATDSSYLASYYGGVLTISKRVSGAYTSIASTSSTVWTAGDVIRFEAQGTALRLYRNGALALSTTDSDVSSGYPGCVHESISANTSYIDDFSAGDFDDTTPDTFSFTDVSGAATLKASVTAMYARRLN